MDLFKGDCLEGTVIIVTVCKLSRKWVINHNNHEYGFVIFKNDFVILILSVVCTHLPLTCLSHFSVAVKRP